MPSIEIPFSLSCERNKEPILSALGAYLSRVDSVLEIGSGTGQHAVFFANKNPHLIWQTSDRAEYLPGIQAQLKNAALDNIERPVELDVTQQKWLESERTFPAIFTANTLHIMDKAAVEHFFAGLGAVSSPRAYLFVYGPFNYQGKYTSQSNADFDASLRARGVGSGIRDFEFVSLLAQQAGFDLLRDEEMPANNRCLIWQRRCD